MNKLNCCSNPFFDSTVTDLGHADSFEFILGKCVHCGKDWLNVFCVATGITGYEPIEPTMAMAMIASEPGKQRKKFMSDWAYEHL